MLLRCRTKVNASAETIFACIDAPEHIVKWVGGAVDHVYLTERDPANPVGQRFLQKLKMGNSVRDFEGRIIAWEKPTHFGLSIPTPAYSSDAHFRISPEGPARSTVDYSIDVTLHTLAARVIGTALRFPLGFFVQDHNGVNPDGHLIEPKYMPWLGYRNMTDDELRSIWLYLRALPSTSRPS